MLDIFINTIPFLSGNHGNTIDGQALAVAGEGVEEVRRNGENPNIHPLTPPVRPVTNDRQYYHIPWEDSKPCAHIKFTWQDHRRRLYNSNVLLKICERLVGGLFLNCKSCRHRARVSKMGLFILVAYLIAWPMHALCCTRQKTLYYQCLYYRIYSTEDSVITSTKLTNSHSMIEHKLQIALNILVLTFFVVPMTTLNVLDHCFH